MKQYSNVIAAYSIMLVLIILVGIFQSWSIALTIFNYCMISAVMTIGANIQWGYAGLINFGIMGYTALGGLAVVLVSVAPVPEAWRVGGLNMMGKYESVFSAYREHWLPRWNKRVKPIGWDIKRRPMRQEIDEVFVENGAFYITSRSKLIQSGLRYSGETGIFEMPFSRSFQVDCKDDVKIVEYLLLAKI